MNRHCMKTAKTNWTDLDKMSSIESNNAIELDLIGPISNLFIICSKCLDMNCLELALYKMDLFGF